MIQSICLHGRLPALSRGELESLYGAAAVIPLGGTATGLALPADEIAISRLGGTPKLARLLTELPTTDWSQITDYLRQTIPGHLGYLAEGKIRFGLSVYGLPVKPSQIEATGLTLKKVIRAAGRSVRLVPNRAAELNAAQVIHNQLTGPSGWELVLVGHAGQTYLAQTVAVQDIAAYAARDQARPQRDARVGMLPPKLAQTIINLAIGQRGTRSPASVLDPFCGSGVIPQEALLMGHQVMASDLDQRMVDYTLANLRWLDQRVGYSGTLINVEVADATSHTWPKPFDTIASETYLGRPFIALPDRDTLRQVIRDVDTIHRKFLANVARQTPAGFRMSIAVPAWQTGPGRFQHLPVLDSLEEIGYNRVSFVHAATQDLIYYRDNQVVGRELVTLIRK